MSVAKTADLADAWYSGRGDFDWQRPDAAAVFDQLGLTDHFWQLTYPNE